RESRNQTSDDADNEGGDEGGADLAGSFTEHVHGSHMFQYTNEGDNATNHEDGRPVDLRNCVATSSGVNEREYGGKYEAEDTDVRLQPDCGERYNAGDQPQHAHHCDDLDPRHLR